MTIPQAAQQQVGGYTLLTRIGEGGMGVVHLARAADGRRVALKLLRPQVIGDAEARRRLDVEVNALRRVTSPRVAGIIDADPGCETPYVVTRYVPGLSLYDHVREEGLVNGEDLRYFADGLAEALQAVHSVGVLHRDVKPSNVLMEGRAPVLIDFGLARLAEDPRLTHTGWLLGTPGYLAPEILYGDDATPAADVHAWAATVVFAATGRSPYGKGPAMAILDRVRLGQHDLNGVPEEYVGLLGRALSPEPSERPSITQARSVLAPATGALQGVARGTGVQDFTRPVVALHRPPATEVRATPAPALPDEAPAASSVPTLPTRQDVPSTRVLPTVPGRSAQPFDRAPDPDAADPTEVDRARSRARGLLLGLGLCATGLVAFAPYLGALVLGVGILLARAASLTRQQHARRRLVRGGRARWFDTPVTTISTPVYLLVSSLGTVLLLCWAAATAMAVGVVVAVLGMPLTPALVLAGLGFAGSLWWGPGSGRVREVARGSARGLARRDKVGLVAAVLLSLAGVGLILTLAGAGPDWAPATSAPWHSGVLAGIGRYLP